MRLWLSLVIAAGLVGGTASAAPGRHAVVSVGAKASELAEPLRHELAKNGAAVMDFESTRVRMRGPRLSTTPLDGSTVKQRYDQAETLYENLKLEQSLDHIEKLVHALEADPHFTTEKATYLLDLHVNAARNLLTLAPKGETGRGETEEGRRARAHLLGVLLLDPLYALDPVRHPPRMRVMMDHARRDIAAAPKGTLAVDSTPQGVPVFVDGKRVGETPIHLVGTPAGNYRVWLEENERRSAQRLIELGASGHDLMVDFALERSIVPEEASFDVLPEDVDDSAAGRLAALLGVSSLVFVHEVQGAEQREVAMMVFDTEQGYFVRRAVALLGSDNVVGAIARFVDGGLTDPSLKPFRLANNSTMLPGRTLIVPPSGSGPQTAPILDAYGIVARRLSDTRLLTDDEVRLALDDEQRAVGCGANGECAASVASRLNADQIVFNRLYLRGGSPWLEVRVFDGVGSPLRVVDGPADAGRVIGLLSRALHVGGHRGDLRIQSSVNGARVILDGVDIGATPLRQVLGLMPGRHQVRFSAAGLDDGNAVVDVPPAGARTVTVERNGRAIAVKVEGAAGPAIATSEHGGSTDAPAAAAKKARPLWPIGVASGGAAVGIVGAVILATAVASVLGGAALYGLSDRTPGGALVARPGETKEMLVARANFTVALFPIGGALAVLGLLGTLGGGALIAVGVVLGFVLPAE